MVLFKPLSDQGWMWYPRFYSWKFIIFYCGLSDKVTSGLMIQSVSNITLLGKILVDWEGVEGGGVTLHSQSALIFYQNIFFFSLFTFWFFFQEVVRLRWEVTWLRPARFSRVVLGVSWSLRQPNPTMNLTPGRNRNTRRIQVLRPLGEYIRKSEKPLEIYFLKKNIL